MSAPQIGCTIIAAAQAAYRDPAKRFDPNYERHVQWMFIRERELSGADIIDLGRGDRVLTDSEVMRTPIDQLAVKYDDGELSRDYRFLQTRHRLHARLMTK